MVFETFPQVPLPSADSGARGGRWISAGTHQDSCAEKNGGLNFLIERLH
jgi:hypothetical protein